MDKKSEILYEGKAKIILKHQDPSSVVQHFKDTVTAFNALKSDSIPNKGIINNKISYVLMRHLDKCGIDTHILKFVNDREQQVKKLDMIPVEVVVRNIAAGSMCKKFGIPKGRKLAAPLVELYYKNDSLSDPMITEEHAVCFGLATQHDLQLMRALALEVNAILTQIFTEVDIQLVDFKVEFGKNSYENDKIVLADEISPDTCRLWDSKKGTVLDKDLYRLGIGNLEEGYSDVLQRIEQQYLHNKNYIS